MTDNRLALNRRRFIGCFSAVGLGGTLLPGALAAVAQDAETITFEMLDAAQAIAGISFTRGEQERILDRLNGGRSPLPAFGLLRDAELGNDTQPAFVFNPVPPGKVLSTERRPLRRQPLDVAMPASDERVGVPSPHTPLSARRDPAGPVDRAHRALSGAIEGVRPQAFLCRQPD